VRTIFGVHASVFCFLAQWGMDGVWCSAARAAHDKTKNLPPFSVDGLDGSSPHSEPPSPPSASLPATDPFPNGCASTKCAAWVPLMLSLTAESCRSECAAERPTMLDVIALLDDAAVELASGSYIDSLGRHKVCKTDPLLLYWRTCLCALSAPALQRKV
jgi:hypothetical protein